jgi:hypothetical protein
VSIIIIYDNYNGTLAHKMFLTTQEATTRMYTHKWGPKARAGLVETIIVFISAALACCFLVTRAIRLCCSSESYFLVVGAFSRLQLRRKSGSALVPRVHASMLGPVGRSPRGVLKSSLNCSYYLILLQPPPPPTPPTTHPRAHSPPARCIHSSHAERPPRPRAVRLACAAKGWCAKLRKG